MCGRFTFQPSEAFYARFQITNRLDSLTARGARPTAAQERESRL